MTSFNKRKLGLYYNYYNNIFHKATQIRERLDSFSYYNSDRMVSSCSLLYPIVNKKMLFTEINRKIIKKKRMKKASNLNQMIILEGTVSSQKCIYIVPLFSFSVNVLKNIF